jgi:hypothetical protein
VVWRHGTSALSFVSSERLQQPSIAIVADCDYVTKSGHQPASAARISTG